MYSNISIFRREIEELFDELRTKLILLAQEPSSPHLPKRLFDYFHNVKLLCSLSELDELAGLVMLVNGSFRGIEQKKIKYTEDIHKGAIATFYFIRQALSSADYDSMELKQLEEFWKQLIRKLNGKKKQKGTKPVTVLIIDDELVNRTLLEEIVKSTLDAVTIISLDTVKEGLYYYFTQDIDLVFLDIMMPDIDGNDFIAIMQKNREQGHLKNAPNIIVQTAVESWDHLMSYVKQECIQEVIRKPLPVERIAQCLRRYCSQ